MSLYKFEMHFHTDESSPCAKVPAKEAVEIYIKAGYDGIVITDHFYKSYCGSPEEYNWEEVCEKFLKGYRLAKECETESFKILLGMEIKFPDACNDFLVYGITEKFLEENPWIYTKDLEYLYSVADKYNLLIVQAHPFREKCYFAQAEFLHGIEVFNGNPDHDSRNILAEKAAEIYNLIEIKGSDFHEEKGISHNYHLLKKMPINESDLVNILIDGSCKI